MSQDRPSGRPDRRKRPVGDSPRERPSKGPRDGRAPGRGPRRPGQRDAEPSRPPRSHGPAKPPATPKPPPAPKPEAPRAPRELRNALLVATTFAGLEEALAAELRALGAEGITVLRRAVEFRGDADLMMRACLHLRLAVRVLLRLGRFRANDSNELYAGVKRIAWAQHLDPDMTLSVSAVGTHPAFDNSMFVGQRVKDAMVDQLREKFGRRPNVDAKSPDVSIHVHLDRMGATVSLDASGEPLSKRGWREQGGQAPMSEALAAGILTLAGWEPGTPLLDPMCGSGTIPIEAARLAAGIPAGAGRRFGFERWKNFDRPAWDRIREVPHVAARGDVLIRGSDMDAGLIKIAKANARRAEVDDLVRLSKGRFEEIEPPAPSGLLITNPPYDERLELEAATVFYKELGDVLKQRYSGWRAAIMTGNLDAAKFIGLKPARRIPMHNGGIECRLLIFELYDGTRRSGAPSGE